MIQAAKIIGTGIARKALRSRTEWLFFFLLLVILVVLVLLYKSGIAVAYAMEPVPYLNELHLGICHDAINQIDDLCEGKNTWKTYGQLDAHTKSSLHFNFNLVKKLMGTELSGKIPSSLDPMFSTNIPSATPVDSIAKQAADLRDVFAPK